MRIPLSALAIVLLATTSATAGGTRLQSSLAPSSQTCEPIACSSGTCLYIGGACTTDADCTKCTATRELCTSNADCAYAPVSGKSKFQLLGTGGVRLSLKDLMSSIDTAATTDGVVGTSDDYLLVVQTFTTSGSNPTAVLKFDANGGKARLDADLSSVLPPAGTGIMAFGSVVRPSGDPASCPGSGNSAADLAARQGISSCASGTVLGTVGLTAGDKTRKLKASIAAFEQTCRTDDVCTAGSCEGSGEACMTNSDCNSCSVYAQPCASNADCRNGMPSAKSSLQVDGAGHLKVKIKGATDGNGAPLTTDGIVNTADDYILTVVFNPFTGSSTTAIVKLDFHDGSAALQVDVSAQMPATGSPTTIAGLLQTPPAVPADCPGTNSPADIGARSGVGACSSGHPRAVLGVESGS